MKATYVALTTVNYQQDGYHEVLTGSNKEQVRQDAERQICGDQWNNTKDIYTQTEIANLIVVSKTEAKRKWGVDIDKASTDWGWG